jgi:hypothetical protein
MPEFKVGQRVHHVSSPSPQMGVKSVDGATVQCEWREGNTWYERAFDAAILVLVPDSQPPVVTNDPGPPLTEQASRFFASHGRRRG